MRTIQHWIAGELTSGGDGRPSPVFNPATGEQQAEVLLGSRADVESAIAAAWDAFPAWSQTSISARTKVLFAFRELVNANAQRIAEAITDEHGKVLSDALGELQRGLEVVEFACGIPQLMKGEFSDQVSSGVDSFSFREPVGVCAGITPFNFPAMVPMWMFPIAIATGNTFVLKPSERDPSVALILAELWQQAGLPDGVFNVVHGDKVAVDTILDSPRVAAVSFVGSTPIAKYIYERGTAAGKRVQALGGAKNHAIVMPDAELDFAADHLAAAAFGSAGERCMALSVAVPVGEETAERLKAAIVERIGNLTVGHGLEKGVDYGPLVAQSALDRVNRLIEEGVQAGADIVVDGRGIDLSDKEFEGESLGGGFFIGPTLFDKVTPEMSIYLEEIFGPVLVMVRANSFEEAIRLPNEHQYGNGVAIF
ncbi:MAG: CoA-acylating methylmalonate-semialdehyde dehydrogenase, partial [Nocardioidaceae bacterium]|nr:CoA-acylating methylmalonate-semialdehyde dehydrogenase [Nocardioidaceae bacterium]